MRDRIDPTGMKRVTSDNSPEGKHTALDHTMQPQRLDRVVGARGRESTRFHREEREAHHTKRLNSEDRRPHADRPFANVSHCSKR